MDSPSLRLWGPDDKIVSGLPSLDPDSLVVLSYLKFAKAEEKISVEYNHFPASKASVPYLRTKEENVQDVVGIIEQLRKLGVNCDGNLDATQSADALATCSMILRSLRPAVMYELWCNSHVYTSLTRRYYARQLYFPAGLVVPGRLHARQTQQLRSLHPSMSESHAAQVILDRGKQCLNWLDKKLTESSYCIGDEATVVDALVVGYLCPLAATQTQSLLQVHLRSCHNLQRYLRRLTASYFPGTVLPDPGAAGDSSSEGSAQLSDYPNRNRNVILALIGAALFTGIYLIGSGLVQFDYDDDDNDEDNDE